MKVNVAIIGGGAITDQLYLSYFKSRENIYNVSLVENNPKRAKELLVKYPYIKNTFSDYTSVIKDVDVGIVALPNFLHARVAGDFINKGVPVFIEKPLAINYEEGLGIVELAKKMNVPIGVGLVKRFFNSSTLIKNLIDSELFGKIKSVLVSDGNEFEWPLQSDSLIDKRKSGGGVLIDAGAHHLDLLCWWFGLPEVTFYSDDNCGNVESECYVELLKDGIEIVVELSRLRKLQQKFEIQFENGTLCYSFMNKKPELKFTSCLNDNFQFSFEIDDNLRKAFACEIESFFLKCNFEGTGKPENNSETVTGLESLQLISSCYGYRK